MKMISMSQKDFDRLTHHYKMLVKETLYAAQQMALEGTPRGNTVSNHLRARIKEAQEVIDNITVKGE